MVDELRARYPGYGMALYALDPHGAVTFEVIDAEGNLFTFIGATAAEAIAMAFPEEVPPETTPAGHAAPNAFD